MIKMNATIKRIAELREARGWTNNRMALEAGIGSSTVLNWYKSNAVPNEDAIRALCEAFGITMSEFYNTEPTPISLSEVQKEFLTEFDCLNKDEKRGLLEFLKSLNISRKKFQ
jgi:transcriptional regulator with XRE-family HTH domain